MVQNIRRPILYEKAIERALEAMRTGQSLRDHPLQFFLSVQKRLESPHFVEGEAARHIAIYDHLIETIIEQLTHVRRFYNIPPPDRDCVDQYIHEDFRHKNAELEAWSLLYHRYVCIAQNLSMEDFSNLVNQPGRTLRRRHRLGISRLTFVLGKAEHELRLHASRQRLRLGLPSSYPPPFFGNHSLISTSLHYLTVIEPSYPVVLHGPAGIGKTTLALVLAHLLIDSEALDDLLWLDLSEVTGTDIILAVVNHLNIPLQPGISHQQALKAYLFDHRTLIVLDNAEALLGNTQKTKAVLSLLDASQIILTSAIEPPVDLWVSLIPVPELNKEQAFAFLEHIAQPKHTYLAENFDRIWRQAGGNPLALKLLLNASNRLPVASALSGTKLDELHRQTWEWLSPVERQIWLLPLFFQNDGMAFEHISMLLDLDEAAVNPALSTLLSAALFTVQGRLQYGLYQITKNFLLEYIQRNVMLSGSETVFDFFRRIFDRRVTQALEQNNSEAALYLLNLGVKLQRPMADLLPYAQGLAPCIQAAGQWGRWGELVAALLDSNHPPSFTVWLHQAAGVALRHIGQLNPAKEHLLEALSRCAENTIEYADILIELSVTHRYEGRWDTATEFAHTARGIYTRFDFAAGIERCIHELAQLALEAANPTQALTWLSRLDKRTARASSIESQAYLLLNRINDALCAAEQALDALPVQHPNRGRALASLAQIHDALNNTDFAVDYMLLATELLDQIKDSLGYARVCNNLAVAYLKQPASHRTVPLRDIRALLTRALQIQEYARDEIGLAVTRQNLAWLNLDGDK